MLSYSWGSGYEILSHLYIYCICMYVNRFFLSTEQGQINRRSMCKLLTFMLDICSPAQIPPTMCNNG